MSDVNSGNERIKEMAKEFHNSTVMEIKVSHISTEPTEPKLDLESIQYQLSRKGLELRRVGRSYVLFEIDESSILKPGWITMNKFAEKYGKHPSKMRQIIGGAPDSIKRKMGKWYVNEEYFYSYMRSCEKYG